MRPNWSDRLNLLQFLSPLVGCQMWCLTNLTPWLNSWTTTVSACQTLRSHLIKMVYLVVIHFELLVLQRKIDEDSHLALLIFIKNTIIFRIKHKSPRGHYMSPVTEMQYLFLNPAKQFFFWSNRIQVTRREVNLCEISCCFLHLWTSQLEIITLLRSIVNTQKLFYHARIVKC